MRPALFILFTLSMVGFSAPAFAQKAAVAAAHGSAEWSKVNTLAFTWKHEGSGAERSYTWDVKKGTVDVVMNGQTVTIPAVGGKLEGAKLDAHKAFINDSYWLLFETFIQRDQVETTDLGEVDVPGFDKRARGLSVQYGSAGGYTPGDKYVLYMNENGQVFAWAFHPGGSAESKFVMARGGQQTFGKLVLPTTFETADGKRFITISNISVSYE